MKGTLSGEVLTGNISGAQRLGGTATPRGNDGISPTIEIAEIEGGTRVTITDINGTKQFDVIGGTSSEQIEELIREHLENNPIDFNESDPTVPAWAKQATKPSYTAEEVGALSADSLQTAINAALSQAKASGEFDGKDGKDGAVGEKGDKGDTGATGAAGQDGIDGKDGEDGITPEFSIGTVTTLSAGSNATATITGTKEKPVLNLGIPKGADGAGGGGSSGEDGEDGGYYIPAVNSSGDLSWNPTKSDMPAVQTVNIKGAKGDTGEKGDPGEPGKDGEKGETGAAGKDGVSASHSWNGTTLTITSASGTSSANLKGEKGDKGDRGEQGIQGVQGIQGIQGETGAKGDKGDTGEQGIQGIQGEPGAKGDKGDKGDTGAAGYSPVRGTDYWTADDIAQIKSYVDDAILGGAW